MTDTYRIAEAADFAGRSTDTISRWEREGRVPPARRVGGQRRYSEDDLRKLKEIAQRPLPTEEPTSSPEPWGEPEAETVTPWAETGGTTEIRQKRLDALPTTCSTCWRSLVRHGVTRPNGQRVLIASCEVHGEQGRQRWT